MLPIGRDLCRGVSSLKGLGRTAETYGALHIEGLSDVLQGRPWNSRVSSDHCGDCGYMLVPSRFDNEC